MRRTSGFTLLELALVLTIVGLLAGISVATLKSLKDRASFSNVSAEVAQAVRRTRAEAFGRGISTAFVIDTVANRWWGVEAPPGWKLDAFNPDAPGAVIVSGRFPRGITFGPDNGYGKTLEAPFEGVPVTLGYSPRCSFCEDAGSNKGFGAVRFDQSGRAIFENKDKIPAIGQQFTLTTPATSDHPTRTVAVAIVEFTGSVESFEEK